MVIARIIAVNPDRMIILAKKKFLEDREQAALFTWATMAQPIIPELSMLFHVPNGGKRDAREAARLKRQGVKAGVPDILLDVPRGTYHGLRIELKVKGGKVTDKQQLWLDRYKAHGYKAIVCYGWLEAKNSIVEYLS